MNAIYFFSIDHDMRIFVLQKHDCTFFIKINRLNHQIFTLLFCFKNMANHRYIKKLKRVQTEKNMTWKNFSNTLFGWQSSGKK